MSIHKLKRVIENDDVLFGSTMAVLGLFGLLCSIAILNYPKEASVPVEVEINMKRERIKKCLYEDLWKADIEQVKQGYQKELLSDFADGQVPGNVLYKAESELGTRIEAMYKKRKNSWGDVTMTTNENAPYGFSIYSGRCGEGLKKYIYYQDTEEVSRMIVREFRSELIARYDQDGDGDLDQEDLNLELIYFDLNKDGKIDDLDEIARQLMKVDLGGAESLISSINMDSNNGQYDLSTEHLNKDGHKVGKDFLDQLTLRRSIEPNFAAHLGLAGLDVNNDLLISDADDVNIDGRIDSQDFEAIRKLEEAMRIKYGEEFDRSKIHPMDIIVFLNHFYKTFDEEMGQADPKLDNFAPFVDRRTVGNEESETGKKYDVPKGQTITKTPGRKKRLSGAVRGAVVGKVLNFPLGPSALLGAAMAPRERSGEYEVEQVYEHHIETNKVSVEYFEIEKEFDETVATAIFTTPDGYKVFYFDASRTLTEVFMQKVASEYMDGKLISRHESTSKTDSKMQGQQATGGRILVLDPKRNMKAIFQEDESGEIFLGLYYGSDAASQMVTERSEELLSPFRQARDLIKSELRQIYALTEGFRHFSPKLSLKRQEVYLQLRALKRQ